MKAEVKNLRKYGKAPFRLVVIHGGPGAAGEMAPVALELSSDCSVLEPLQTAASVEGQIKELRMVLEKNGSLPVTLIGFSWGAWLSFIFAASYPSFVEKIILIGSGCFEEKYAEKIEETRLKRLNEEDRSEVKAIMKALDNSAADNKRRIFARFGEIFTKADAFDPLPYQLQVIDYRVEIFQCVWKDARELRRSGKLLEFGKHVKCPVTVIHGDYDPHPFEGVQKPLSDVLGDFKFILLRNCGHMPWIERQAKAEFFKILRQEMCQTIQS